VSIFVPPRGKKGKRKKEKGKRKKEVSLSKLK
jgi:hypothetical protein